MYFLSLSCSPEVKVTYPEGNPIFFSCDTLQLFLRDMSLSQAREEVYIIFCKYRICPRASSQRQRRLEEHTWNLNPPWLTCIVAKEQQLPTTDDSVPHPTVKAEFSHRIGKVYFKCLCLISVSSSHDICLMVINQCWNIDRPVIWESRLLTRFLLYLRLDP